MSQQLIYSDDPYDRFIREQSQAQNLIANDRSSKFSRKYRKFKNDLIIKKSYFLMGGLQGFAIGCLAGLGMGLFTAWQAKRLIVIPLSMLGSGMFFACVMAFGSVLRTADHSMVFSQSMPAELKQQYVLAEYVVEMQQLINTSAKAQLTL